jgi:hypothetical protein
MSSHTEGLGDDLLYGAGEIAGFVFGSTDEKARRRVYHRAPDWPLFRMGAVICGRKSTLSAHISQQENAPRRRVRRKT